MSDSSKKSEAFEIIELAIDDINILARAFDVIQEVCEGREEREEPREELPAEIQFH